MPNILVIDDDDIMLKAIKNILHKDGFDVLTARDGKEAFEMLDNSSYDIVITDLMMPVLGPEKTEQLIELINRLETVQDIRQVRPLITTGA